MAAKALDPFTEWLHRCSRAHCLVWSECCTSSLDLSIPLPCERYLGQWGFVLLVWALEKRVWNKSTHGLHMHCVSQEPSVNVCVCEHVHKCVYCVYLCACYTCVLCVYCMCVCIYVCAFSWWQPFLGMSGPLDWCVSQNYPMGQFM